MPTADWEENSAGEWPWTHRVTRGRFGLRAQDASESIAAAGFGVDDIAVRAQRFAQRAYVKLQVFFDNHDARPHPAEKLFFGDERAVSLQKDQKYIKSARAEYDRNAIG